MNLMNFIVLNNLLGKKEVHVETIHIDSNYRELLEHAKKHNPICFCITPMNYEWVKWTFGIGLSKKQYSLLLKERYNKLKECAEIQLHIHLPRYTNLVSDKTKKKMIEESYVWMKKNVTKPDKIIFGAYSYDKKMEGVAKSLDLKIIKRHFHVYARRLG